uniref:Uncharacterized protein n=1 Tax=Heterosigma akashiwo TaxID=2829 RepID=A0A7S3UXM9_HETAK
MCMQGDVEIIHNWRSTHSIDDLKRIVQEKGYSCFTVSSGNPSFGHAALKKFPYQVTKDHCKPISQCCRHPCTIYIYHPPSSGAIITAQPGAQGTGPEWTNPRPKISAEEIAGCWCCACIPGGCALYAKEARGPDALVHKGLALIFFGLPICFEEHRTRHPNTNGFFKNGEPGNIDTYSSKDCACNGSACNIRIVPGGGSTVVSGQPVPHHQGNDPNWTAPYPKIETHEIAGCWLCGCIPGGCAIYQKQQKEPDVLVHKGCFFLFWAIPMFFAEDRIRHPNTNGFYKRGEPGNVESYSSARYGGGGGACAFKICDC